ncbi:hypothetical protein D3C81_1966370 [compost metagenome]
MVHRCPGGQPGIVIILGVAPVRIGIPGDNIQNFGQLAVINSVDHMHIGCNRQLRVVIPDGDNFMTAEINHPLADKPPPVEVQAVNLSLAMRSRGINLIP